MPQQTATRFGLALAAALLLFAGAAHAGIPECKNLRLQDAGSCRVEGDLQCMGSCNDLGIYKKACATQLHTVCRSDCTLKAEAGCTDECTISCTEMCDRGVNVICIHNCFGECVGSCDAGCADATDPDQCHATCEANCDGECDIKCTPLVDGDCYKHCVECCGGSCTAQANLDCQTTCQEEEFETCELELRVDCMGSCDGDGALFCDGEYVMSGPEIVDCAEALVQEGLSVDLRAEIEAGVDKLNASVKGSACSVSSAGTRSAPGGGWLLVTALLFGHAFRRRISRRRAAPSSTARSARERP